MYGDESVEMCLVEKIGRSRYSELEVRVCGC
jgi:hypothetical protein